MTIQRRLLLVFLLGNLLCISLSGQTFNCDGRLLLGTSNDQATRIYRIGFIPFAGVSYSNIATYVGERFDGLGFNAKDNYIYAVRQNDNTVVQLRADGTINELGPVPIVDQLEVFAGDCTLDGRYICHDNNLDQLLVFQVVDGFALEERIDLFWDPNSENSGPFTTRLDDFAIDPNNPNRAFAVQGTGNFDPDLLPLETGGFLLAINLNPTDADYGMVTPVAPLEINLDLARVGSLFYNDFGVLYGYGAQLNVQSGFDKRLFTINTFTGGANAQGPGGPAAPASDGCSCPYSLSVDYFVEPLVATCTDDEVTYTMTVNNRSYESLSITLTDTLAEGTVIESFTNTFVGEVSPETGIGTRFLTINNFQVPPRGIVQLSITARIVDVFVGNVASQVRLLDLPILFGEEILSDDPMTSSLNDPAIFAADAIFLENVEVDVISPTDCLSDNDGQMTVASPQFLPGVSYQIGLFNEDWEPLTRAVVVDNNNSFFLDSLAAGEYRLDQVMPENLRCSYEWKDTTILIEPPNDQLQAAVVSNSPLCAGEDLTLNAVLSPGGEVVWRGPLFINIGDSVMWEAVDTSYGGIYEMTATYGACEQIRESEVIVKPAIAAAISGTRDYCEREQLQLKADGVGDSLLFQWSGPNVPREDARIVRVNSVAPTDDGVYEVMIDNGACRDTAIAVVNVLPSPTIELPKFLETDFCDPVTLRPQITGDDDVIYAWTPSEGLSCDDCPEPEIRLPLLPEYRLFVVNDTLCTDSTSVRVFFRGDDLIYIPNAFSPNDDGVNDRFQIFPSCAVAAIESMEVYDRWGNLVFAERLLNPDDPTGFWDGRVNGKIAATGVYLWRVEIRMVNGEYRSWSGEISLVR